MKIINYENNKYRIPSLYELKNDFKYEEWNDCFKKWEKKKWVDISNLIKKYPWYGIQTILNLYEDNREFFKKVLNDKKIRVFIDKSDFFYELHRFYNLWALKLPGKFISHNTLIIQKLVRKKYDEAYKYIRNLLQKEKHLIQGYFFEEFIKLYLDYLLKRFYIKIGIYSRINFHDHTVAGGPYISTEKPFKLKISTSLETNINLEAKPMKSKNKIKILQQQNELLSKLRKEVQELPLENYIVYYFDKDAGTNHSMTIVARTLKRVFNKLKIQYKINPDHVLWIRKEKEPSIDLYLRKKEIVNKLNSKEWVKIKKSQYPTTKYISYDKKVCIKRQLEDKSWEIKRVWKSEIGKVYSSHEWSYCPKKLYKALGRPLKQIKTVKVDLYKASASSYEYNNEEWKSLTKLKQSLSDLYTAKDTDSNWKKIIEVEKKIKDLKYKIRGRRLENKEKVYKEDKYGNRRYKYKNKIIKVSQKTIPLSQKEYINPPKPGYNYFYKKKHKLDLWKKRNKTWRGYIKSKRVIRNKSLKQKHLQNNYK
jgi:hypothetical protein